MYHPIKTYKDINQTWKKILFIYQQSYTIFKVFVKYLLFQFQMPNIYIVQIYGCNRKTIKYNGTEYFHS